MGFTAQNWIDEQLQGGKSENDIIAALTQKGWTESDARKAVESARQPTLSQQLTPAEQGIFLGALAGIAVFLWYLIDKAGIRAVELGDTFSSGINSFANALLIALALALFTWVLYSISIRHHHPRLHKLFFLWTGKVVSAGYVAWIAFIALAALEATQVVVTTFALILFAGAMLALGVIFLELVYYRLRKQYDDLPAKSPKRLVMVGLSLFVVYVVVLSGTAFYTENWLLEELEERNGDSFDTIDASLEETPLSPLIIPNTLLRERFTDDLREYERLKDLRAPHLTVEEFIGDSGWSPRCDALTRGVQAGLFIYVDARLLEDYLSFKAARGTATPDMQKYRAALTQRSITLPSVEELPMRYKPYEELMACLTEKVEQQSGIYRGFPADPDLSDPAQRELVEFVLWREAELEKARD